MENTRQKKIRGNVTKALDDTEEKANTSIAENRWNQYLTYDILRIIFKYLNGMDLSSASLVCRSWLEAANNEKRTRGPFSLIEFLTNQKRSKEYLKSQIIKKLPIKPALGLFFTTTSVSFDEKDCHCKVLPPNCNTITLDTYGVVLNNKEIEENLGHIVCAFLPEIPDVTIKTAILRKDSSTRSDMTKSVGKYTDELKKILGPPKRNGNNSKCLLLFCDLVSRSFAIKVANSLKRSYSENVFSVWGGVARDLLVCAPTKDRKDRHGEFVFCVGIALIGAVDTWSVIVDKSYKTKEQVEQRLKSLKNGVCLKKHSMGFMFACCARGENMFDEHDVESTIFKKVFPEVPLIGCFGDGEFGENSITTESTNKRTRWYNETSTVFMILTYG